MNTKARDRRGRKVSKRERVLLARRRQKIKTTVTWSVVAVASVALLALAFFTGSGRPSGADAGTNGRYPYQVGSPGPGDPAPEFTLEGTDGKPFSLAAARGETVLIFFQEGIACQPCWDNQRDIEARMDELKALGVDRMVTVTTDPLEYSAEKVGMEGLRLPVLADHHVDVSGAYDMPRYGMHPMEGSVNGHSFVLVNEEGVIEWRADYGAAPNYTMYVPVDALLADMKQALEGWDMTIEILVLTQPDCAFCDQTFEILERLKDQYGLRITTLDIATEEGARLASEGGILFAPGIFVDGEPVCYGRLSERRLRKHLDRPARVVDT